MIYSCTACSLFFNNVIGLNNGNRHQLHAAGHSDRTRANAGHVWRAVERPPTIRFFPVPKQSTRPLNSRCLSSSQYLMPAQYPLPTSFYNLRETDSIDSGILVHCTFAQMEHKMTTINIFSVCRCCTEGRHMCSHTRVHSKHNSRTGTRNPSPSIHTPETQGEAHAPRKRSALTPACSMKRACVAAMAAGSAVFNYSTTFLDKSLLLG